LVSDFAEEVSAGSTLTGSAVEASSAIANCQVKEVDARGKIRGEKEEGKCGRQGCSKFFFSISMTICEFLSENMGLEAIFWR